MPLSAGSTESIRQGTAYVNAHPRFLIRRRSESTYTLLRDMSPATESEVPLSVSSHVGRPAAVKLESCCCNCAGASIMVTAIPVIICQLL